jgi:hypothetical protein
MDTATLTKLTLIGEKIANAAETDPILLGMILNEVHSFNHGAEILRLIVRDDLGGGANAIANALWVNL